MKTIGLTLRYTGESDEMTTNGKEYFIFKEKTFIDDEGELTKLSGDFLKYFEIVEVKKEISKEDFASGFAEWIRENAIEVSDGWQFDGKNYNDSQLLEIYKKEKGL